MERVKVISAVAVSLMLAGSVLAGSAHNGGQFCMVMPKYNLVLVKINGYRKPFTEIMEFYPLIMKGLGEKS